MLHLLLQSSSQMHGPVFLDRFNNPVRPALLRCDQRAGRESAEIIAKVDDLVIEPA